MACHPLRRARQVRTHHSGSVVDPQFGGIGLGPEADVVDANALRQCPRTRDDALLDLVMRQSARGGKCYAESPDAILLQTAAARRHVSAGLGSRARVVAFRWRSRGFALVPRRSGCVTHRRVFLAWRRPVPECPGTFLVVLPIADAAACAKAHAEARPNWIRLRRVPVSS